MAILGPTGRNFAAGMSGGIAYVLADMEAFRIQCNLGTVELETLEEDEDIAELHAMISKHAELTRSTVAAALLSDWSSSIRRFVKVMPTDYKRVLNEMKQSKREMAKA